MANAFQKHILNQDREEEQAVDAPAFSLTKVLGLGAVIIAPLATYITDQLADIELGPTHFVALALGVLGFLAITAAADVLARGIASAASKSVEVAEKNVEAAAAEAELQREFAKEQAKAQADLDDIGIARLIRFKKPIAAHRRVRDEDEDKPDVAVKLLAVAQGRRAYFLAQEGEKVDWIRERDVTIP